MYFYTGEKFQKLNSLAKRKCQAMIVLCDYAVLPCDLMNNQMVLSTRVVMDAHAESALNFQMEPFLQ